MKGDRVEAMVDTGQGVQTFYIVATKAWMMEFEVVTSRGVVEVPAQVTRTGVTPVRTGRFMANRLDPRWSSIRPPTNAGGSKSVRATACNRADQTASDSMPSARSGTRR